MDAQGNAVAAAIIALAPPLRFDENGPAAQIFLTDANGEFEVHNIEAGDYGVSATSPAGVGVFAGVVKLGAEPDATRAPIAIRLGTEGFTLRGVVKDELGAPLPSARVDAVEVPQDQLTFATVTDDYGAYELKLPTGHPFLIMVSEGKRSRLYTRCDPVATELDMTLGPPPGARPSDAQLEAWLGKQAMAIDTVTPGSPLDDLASLLATIGDAHIVALGEATHGSQEIFQMKHRLVELLVERMGFSVIALESGYGETLALDAYIHGGPGTAAEAVRNMVVTPLATPEFIELVEALRHYNAGHGNAVSVSGFDIMSFRPAERLPLYFESAGRADATMVEALAPLATYEADGTYASLAAPIRARARAAIDRAIEQLDREKDAFIAATDEAAWTVARHLATVLDQAERSYLDPTFRDSALADNIGWLRDQQPGARIAVWAHNAHVVAAPWMFEDMGRRLRQRYGDDYVVIGTAFGSGGVRALGADRRAGPTQHQVHDPDPNGFDSALRLAKRAAFAVDLRAISDPTVARWLAGAMPVWSIGFAFSDEAGAKVQLAPARAFDIVVYLDRVTAAAGMPR